MLFAALAPSLAHAMAASRGDGWSQICSASGTRMVRMDLADSAIAAPVDQDTAHLEHCPFCATHADTHALPPTAAVALPLIAAPASHPFLFFQSPRPLAIWMAAQSRGPPASV